MYIKDSKLKQDWVFGSKVKRLLNIILSVIQRKHIGASVINPSGDWTPYLPTREYQKHRKYDDYGCVSHSAQNALETMAYFKIVNGDVDLETVLRKFDCIDDEGRPNFDDWFTVLMSGTIPWRGNNQRNVWESLRKDGVIGEQFDFNDLTTQSMYNDKSKITPEMEQKAKEILTYLDINWEHIERMHKFGGSFPYSADAVLKDAMKRSPLQVVVLNNTHCEMAYKVMGHHTFNSYKGTELKTYSDCTKWAYPIGCHIGVKKEKLKEIQKISKYMTYKIHENATICVKVEGEDAYLAFASGVLEGGKLFKSIYGVEFKAVPRTYVEEWQHPIKYEITTTKS